MPVFSTTSELVGYTAIKAHWLDIGGKEPYSTDTVDVFQEGTIFPGVKLYRARASSSTTSTAWRSPTRACRRWWPATSTPRSSACAPGRPRCCALVERYGLETLPRARVERMFDHGEAVVRSYFEQAPRRPLRRPRARWTTTASTTTPVPFEVALEVDGSTGPARLHRRARRSRPGRSTARCPRPSRRAAIAIAMLAGGGEAPNEGHFRADRGRSRGRGRCSTRCTRRRASSTAGPAIQAIEAIYHAVAKAMPERRAGVQRRRHLRARLVGRARGRRASRGPTARRTRSGRARIAARRRREQPHARRRVGHALLAHGGLGGEEPLADRARRARARTPAGRAGTAAGSGSTSTSTMLEDAYADVRGRAHEERALGSRGRRRGAGQQRLAAAARTAPTTRFGKATRLAVPRGATVRLRTGGGGGYGEPAERDPAAVHADIREGYISEEHARRHYPHAFEERRVSGVRRIEIARRRPRSRAAARSSARAAAARSTPAR